MTYNSTYLNQKIENALWIDATSASFRMPKKNQFARDQNFQYNIVAGFYTLFNSFMTEAVIIYKPVHWFALEINGPVSIW